jgi:hypothetical protein
VSRLGFGILLGAVGGALIALLLEESREKTEGWLLGKGWKVIEDPAEEAPQPA